MTVSFAAAPRDWRALRSVCTEAVLTHFPSLLSVVLSELGPAQCLACEPAVNSLAKSLVSSVDRVDTKSCRQDR